MLPEFNLADEGWILVRTATGEVRKLSLPGVLKQAHELRSLAGDTATQDAAVMRLLLAVLYAIVLRSGTDGEPALPEDESEVLERWETIWQSRRLPEQSIDNYFAEWHERFWLFHEERPFYQVPSAKNRVSKPYAVAKMMGDLMESGNKARLFSNRSGAGKESLEYAEAARWLLYLMLYDDGALKPTQAAKSDPDRGSASIGWLGKLGYIEIEGENLFETLMLNLVLLKDGDRMWELEGDLPEWERSKCSERELKSIAIAQGPMELMTLQMRRILLLPDNGVVRQYCLYSGDLPETKNNFSEQYTLWKRIEDKKTGEVWWIPKLHDPSRQLWREFAALAGATEGDRKPGVLNWYARLTSEGIVDKKRQLRCRIIANGYDSNPTSRCVIDSFSDFLQFNGNLLGELGRVWRQLILDEIGNCDMAAKQLGRLNAALAEAAGVHAESPSGKNTLDSLRKAAKREFYDSCDKSFRRWLTQLDADQDITARREKVTEWRKEACKLALSLGSSMVEQAGEPAFIGRKIDDRFCNAASAYNDFFRQIQNIYKGGEA